MTLDSSFGSVLFYRLFRQLKEPSLVLVASPPAVNPLAIFCQLSVARKKLARAKRKLRVGCCALPGKLSKRNMTTGRAINHLSLALLSIKDGQKWCNIVVKVANFTL